MSTLTTVRPPFCDAKSLIVGSLILTRPFSTGSSSADVDELVRAMNPMYLLDLPKTLKSVETWARLVGPLDLDFSKATKTTRAVARGLQVDLSVPCSGDFFEIIRQMNARSGEYGLIAVDESSGWSMWHSVLFPSGTEPVGIEHSYAEWLEQMGEWVVLTTARINAGNADLKAYRDDTVRAMLSDISQTAN